jgi:hypothetical protein
MDKPMDKPIGIGDEFVWRRRKARVIGYLMKHDGYESDLVEFSVNGDTLPWAATFRMLEGITGLKFKKPPKSPSETQEEDPASLG